MSVLFHSTCYSCITNEIIANMSRIQGKACVVTGAAGGIGSATARRFLAEGAAGVVCADVDEAGVNAIVQELNEEFGEGKAIPIVRYKTYINIKLTK